MKTSNPVKKRIFRIGKYLLAGIFVLAGSLFFLYPQIFYCELIRFSSFIQGSKRTFFSPDISISGYKQMATILSEAEMRVDSFYTGRQAAPVFIICSNPEEYQKYCSSTEGSGCSLGTPWGSSFVVLNAQGMNVDVISHEMSHTELLARLGWWKVTTQVPQWFNEGLALMLDRRFVNNPDPAGRYLDYMDEWLYYTRGGQEILELRNIVSLKGFFAGNQQHVMLAYMSAGMEVSYWSALSGKGGIQTLIRLISSGRSFDDAYRLTQQKGKKIYFKKLPTNPLRFQDSKKISE